MAIIEELETVAVAIESQGISVARRLAAMVREMKALPGGSNLIHQVALGIGFYSPFYVGPSGTREMLDRAGFAIGLGKASLPLRPVN